MAFLDQSSEATASRETNNTVTKFLSIKFLAKALLHSEFSKSHIVYTSPSEE